MKALPQVLVLSCTQILLFSALEAEHCCAKIQVKASYLERKRASCNELATSPIFAASHCLGTNCSEFLPPQDTSGFSLCCSGNPVCCSCWPSSFYMQGVRASWPLSYLRHLIKTGEAWCFGPVSVALWLVIPAEEARHWGLPAARLSSG